MKGKTIVFIIIQSIFFIYGVAAVMHGNQPLGTVILVSNFILVALGIASLVADRKNRKDDE